MRPIYILACAGVLTVVSFAALGGAAPSSEVPTVSFQSARERVFSSPLSQLPWIKGVSGGTLFWTALGIHTRLFRTARALFSESAADFKTYPQRKLFHPMGVCADARWKMNSASAFTGLFATGTDVPAIVRLSTGTDQTTYWPGKKRLFGLAIKLFPSTREDVASPTVNLNLLDQYGLTGEDRPSFFGPTSWGDPVTFRNRAAGTGIAVKLLNRAFKVIDRNPTRRPTWPIAAVDSSGGEVSGPISPELIELAPAMPLKEGVSAGTDFRTELLAYPDESITFAIRADGIDLGVLELGHLVVSEACDRELNFRHPSNRNPSGK